MVRPKATRAGREWSDQEQTGFVMSNKSWNQCWNVEHDVRKICQKALCGTQVFPGVLVRLMAEGRDFQLYWIAWIAKQTVTIFVQW